MLIHPWDAPLDDAEWRDLLARNDFGQLIAAGVDRPVPVVVPTHFTVVDGGDVELHLARPNPVWAAIEERPTVLLTVIADYAFIPASWNAGEERHGVPTSYYASVQLQAEATVVRDEQAKRELLDRQLAHFQPEEPIDLEGRPDIARLLPGILGLRLRVTEARAKLKYGGNRPVEHRTQVAEQLLGRGAPLDLAARAHLLRRSEG